MQLTTSTPPFALGTQITYGTKRREMFFFHATGVVSSMAPISRSIPYSSSAKPQNPKGPVFAKETKGSESKSRPAVLTWLAYAIIQQPNLDSAPSPFPILAPFAGLTATDPMMTISTCDSATHRAFRNGFQHRGIAHHAAIMLRTSFFVP